MPRATATAGTPSAKPTTSGSSRHSSSQRQTTAAAPASPHASAAGARGDGTNYLVALAGMKALESHVQDPSRGRKWKDRVTSWEERAGLGLPSVKLALGFLDVLGVRPGKTQNMSTTITPSQKGYLPYKERRQQQYKERRQYRQTIQQHYW